MMINVNEYYRSITHHHERSIKSPIIQNEDEDYIIRIQSCSTPEEIQRIISEIKNSPSSSKKSNPEDLEILQDSQDPYDDIEI
ncbi:hypothetical protein R6Q59_028035 [Mikania micrantha]